MEFQAKWIRTSEETGGVCPVFRKGWKTEKEVERATLYLTALGVYEAHLNGKRVTLKALLSAPNADNTRGTLTFDYSEYLRLFLNTAMLAAGYQPALARIGDCIQVNTDSDITKMSTMLSIEATVTNRTTFMRKIADWSGAGWQYGDSYSIDYKSVLGY